MYFRNGGTWHRQAYVKAPNSDAGDGFGSQVAVDGDVIAIGAPREDAAQVGASAAPSDADDGATDSGAVYVFARESSGWSAEAFVKPNNTQADDLFGWSLDLADDVLIVGAYQEDGSDEGLLDAGPLSDPTPASISGAAYVLTRSNGNWTQQRYLKASNTRTGARFGWDVGATADWLLVGADNEATASRRHAGCADRKRRHLPVLKRDGPAPKSRPVVRFISRDLARSRLRS